MEPYKYACIAVTRILINFDPLQVAPKYEGADHIRYTWSSCGGTMFHRCTANIYLVR